MRLFDPSVTATGNVIARHASAFAVVDRGGLQRRRGDARAGRGDARVSGAVASPAGGHRRRRRRRAGAERRPRRQPVLPRPVEPRRVRVGAPLRLAGADHARRADRVGDLGAHRFRRATAAGRCAAGRRAWRRHARLSRERARRCPPMHRAIAARAHASRLRRSRSLAWLPVAFAVWYFAAPVLLWPVVLLLRGSSRARASPTSCARSSSRRRSLTFVTTLRPGDDRAAAACSPSTSTCCCTRSACRCSRR